MTNECSYPTPNRSSTVCKCLFTTALVHVIRPALSGEALASQIDQLKQVQCKISKTASDIHCWDVALPPSVGLGLSIDIISYFHLCDYYLVVRFGKAVRRTCTTSVPSLTQVCCSF